MIREEFAFLVLSIVEEIPNGFVATYGQIASLAGYPKHSRLVGTILSHAELYGNYPCHRVVNHSGRLAPHFPKQKELLENEGIVLKNGYVDLSVYQWKRGIS